MEEAHDVANTPTPIAVCSIDIFDAMSIVMT
jgi:hypothetical protein